MILKTINDIFLRYSLKSKAWANKIAGLLVTIAGAGIGLEFFTGSIKVYHDVTLKEALLGIGATGVAITKLTVADPTKLDELKNVLAQKSNTDPK